MNYLSFNHSCTNNSKYYVLIGNCRDLISKHETIVEAKKALNNIEIGDSKWSRVEILSPGQTSELKNLQKHFTEPVEFDFSSV